MVHKQNRIIMLMLVLVMIFILQSSKVTAEDETGILFYEGEDYCVEVVYGENAGIPKDAYLKVNEISENSSEYMEYYFHTQEAISGDDSKEDNDLKISYARYFDVAIMSGNEEIEPDETVMVTISGLENVWKETEDDIEIIHFTEEGKEEFLCIKEEKVRNECIEKVMFEQESFSVIGMIIFSGVDTELKEINSEYLEKIDAMSVKKEWSDGAEKHVEDEITVSLYTQLPGENKWEECKKLTLNKANSWKSQFENLNPKNKYRVKETKITSDNLDKTDIYKSTINMTTTEKWCSIEDISDGKSVYLVFNDGKYAFLRKSSVIEEKNLRRSSISVKEGAYGKYLDANVSTMYVWEVTWNEEHKAWELFNPRGSAYLTLEYNQEKDCYEWATSQEKTEGSYLSFENGRISSTVGNVKKYLGNITSQGPYEGLDEGDTGIVKFEIFEYKPWGPGECNIYNELNEKVKEQEILTDITTEKKIDYLGDGKENPETNVDNNTPDNILRDLYRLKLGMKMRTDVTGLDLLLVIDVSSSMKGVSDARDDEGNKITRAEALRQALNRFVPDFLKKDTKNRISLVAFERDAMIIQDWTNNSEDVLYYINREVDGEMPLYNGDGTDYEAALARAHEALSQRGYSSNATAMIFLSDGDPTVYIDGNDDIEPGNVTLDIGSASLADEGIVGTLPDGMKYVSNSEGTIARIEADHAIVSFKKHNPEIMTGAIAFNTIITDTLMNLTTDQKFAKEIMEGSPTDLIDAMELITEYIPKNIVVTDELSENVEFYTDDLDLLVKMKSENEEEVILYSSENGISEEGEKILDNKSPYIIEDKKLKIIFNEEFDVKNDSIYQFSFNIQASQRAFDKFSEAEGTYSDYGDEETDYNDNSTSSSKRGFFSNSGNSNISYLLNGAENVKNFRKPVIQVRDGSLSVKKTDLSGNKVLKDANFKLYREADKDEAEKYVQVAEGKTDENGEVVFEHLRLSVFDSGYKYFLIEENAPSGYKKEENAISFRLYSDKAILEDENRRITSSIVLTEDENVIPQIIIRNAEYTDFVFTKIEKGNRENELTGARFSLYEFVCKKEEHEHEEDECWEYLMSENSNPEVRFHNISSGSVYKLIEEKAPDDYICPEGYWMIKINDDKTVDITKEGDSPDLIKTEEGKYLLENEHALKIPVTGGSGTTWMFVIGMIIITGGIIMLNKKSNSRFLVMLMTVLLVFQMLSTTAFAIESSDTGMVTVENVEKGVNVSAYRLMDINYDYEVDQPKNPMYKWTEGIAEWMENQYREYIDTENQNAVTEAFSEANEIDIAEVYDKLAVAIKDGTVVLTSEETEAEGDSVTIENLEMGNYFILIEGGLKVYRPLSANVVPEWKNNAWTMTNPVVSAKSSEPSITKVIAGNIKTDNAAIGDTVRFEVNAVIPSYPEHSKAKKYVISDQMSEGLTLVESSLKVYGASNGKEDVLLTDAFSKTVEESGFSLDFDYAKISSYESVKVTYDTIMNERAAVGTDGNGNTACLKYSNNPYVETSLNTDEDKTTVFTYGMNISKVDEDSETGLSGAEFTVTKDGTELKFTGDNGEYHVSKTDETGDTVVKVDNDGKLVLDGLDAGTYLLTEVKAPEGYVKLQNPVEVVIEDENMNGKIETEKQDTDSGYVFVTVKNDKGFTLPVTGGMGTTLFSIAGIVLMSSGFILMVSFCKKRRNSK